MFLLLHLLIVRAGFKVKRWIFMFFSVFMFYVFELVSQLKYEVGCSLHNRDYITYILTVISIICCIELLFAAITQ